MAIFKLFEYQAAATNSLTKVAGKKQSLRGLFVLSLTLVLTSPGGAHARGAIHQQNFASGHIIVKPRGTVPDAQFSAAMARRGGRDMRPLRGRGAHIVNVAPGQEEAAVQAMALDPTVEYAEVDRLVRPELINPNDVYYAYAWHLAKIGAPAAWDSSTGSGVTVAILDSGIDPSHPDLVGHLVPGWNIVDNNNNTRDVFGHGTMVAGVIGALWNNGIGVTSIAPNTSLMPVRVALSSGSAYISTIANGITYAADHGAKIANASFATLTGSATIQNAANYMRSKGGLVVVAAGNYGVLDSTPNNSSVIAVSASDGGDRLASWSSYGPYVDVAAPGDGIWTTVNGGGYAAVSGTSFSSPAACAVLALMKSANPSLSNTQLESLLKSTAVDLGTPGNDQFYGYGRVNAAAAVVAAKSVNVAKAVIDTTAPTTRISAPTGGNVSSVVTVKVTASDNIGVARVDLYAGGALIGTARAAPYTFSWNTKVVANAPTSLVAYAYDKAGNKGTSPSVAVTVKNPVADTLAPSVNILSPTNNSTAKGTVTVKLSASDNVRVTALTLYIDNVLRSSTNATNLSFAWNAATATKGTHTLRATAKDAAGNTSSKSINVTK